MSTLNEFIFKFRIRLNALLSWECTDEIWKSVMVLLSKTRKALILYKFIFLKALLVVNNLNMNALPHSIRHLNLYGVNHFSSSYSFAQPHFGDGTILSPPPQPAVALVDKSASGFRDDGDDGLFAASEREAGVGQNVHGRCKFQENG